MKKQGKAMWMDMIFYKNRRIAEEREHKRYRGIVQSCLLHSCESWSWNKEMVDALHGWARRNLDLMSSRRWAQKRLSLEWFRAHQIKGATQRFNERGRKNIGCLVLQRNWNYKKRIFDKKKGKKTDKMMRNILKHANAEWREQRSTCPKILGPRNQERMKRRKAGVVHTNWDWNS